MPGPPAAVAAVRHAVRGPLRAAAEEGAGVLVACSGGADSLALAAGLAFEADRLRRRGGRVLSGAVVVDHALQGGSAEVAARAAATCRALGLDPVLVRRVEVGRGDGPEAAAREARYDAFAEVLDGLGAPDRSVRVWLAHTADDQAEQVLLGLLRGAGTRSLAGMPARRGPYERPLLGLRRATTREACADQGLAPHQDPHNDDPRFARVRIRQALAVLGDAAGEDLVPALARSADHLRADADLLDALAAGRAAALTEHPGPAWPVEELAGVEAALRPRVWRRLVQRAHGAGPVPTHTHLAGLDRLLTGWTGQGPVHLPGGHRWARWRRDGVAVVGPLPVGHNEPQPCTPEDGETGGR